MAHRGCLGSLQRRLLVVHHWDADGIASAAILAREAGLEGVEFTVPVIGEYSVDAVASRVRGFDGYDVIYVLDYGIAGVLGELHVRSGGLPIVYVDHHRVGCGGCGAWCGCCNPVALGWGGEREYPSAALLLSELVGHSWDLGAVGLVGDVPGVVERRPGLVSRLVRGYGVGLGELRNAVENVDSCYPLLDYDCIRHAVKVLAVGGVSEAACDARLSGARERLRRVLEGYVAEMLSKAVRLGPVLFSELEGDYLVYSKLGRRLAEEAGPRGAGVLAFYMPSMGKGVVYVRSVGRSVSWLIDYARGRGFNAGGKERVAVIHVRAGREEFQELAVRLAELVSGRLSGSQA